MTYSLRESRAETQRQNEAKLALEQRLGQTEKLATIGQLAAEIAHEVGTPLNVIAGRARSIQKKSKDPDAVEKNAEIVAEQTARITRIIQRLLDFTRRKVGHTAPARRQPQRPLGLRPSSSWRASSPPPRSAPASTAPRPCPASPATPTASSRS